MNGLIWRAIDAQLAAEEDPEVARKRRERLSAAYRIGHIREAIKAREETRGFMRAAGHDPNQFPALRIDDLQQELSNLERTLSAG